MQFYFFSLWAEFLIISMKQDINDLLEYIPFPIAGFHLQSQSLAIRADAVLHADDWTDCGHCVTQHSSPVLAADSADQQAACVQLWSVVERLIWKAREKQIRCQWKWVVGSNFCVVSGVRFRNHMSRELLYCRAI